MFSSIFAKSEEIDKNDMNNDILDVFTIKTKIQQSYYISNNLLLFIKHNINIKIIIDKKLKIQETLNFKQ